MPNHILYLSHEDVTKVCQEIDVVKVVKEALCLHSNNEVVVPDEAYLSWTTNSGQPVRSLNMPGYLGGHINSAGTKIINSNPNNIYSGLPRANGVTLLFEKESVRVSCIMDAGYISALRTAAVSVLSAQVLQGVAIERVGIVGAGVLGSAHISLISKMLNTVTEVAVYDIDLPRAEQLCETIRTSLGRMLNITITDSPQAAISNSHLVVTTTTTRTPYIGYHWLMPGTILVNVSLDDVMPEVVHKCDLLFVDDWKLVKNDSHRLLGKMYRGGQLVGPRDETCNGARRLDAEIGDVLTGKHPGRRHMNEIIVVNPFGLSIEDIAVATEVYLVAMRNGLGVRLNP